MCKKLVYLLSLLLVLGLAGSAGAAVPPPFLNQDIGEDHGGVVGSADYDSATGTLTVIGDGQDIWNDDDDFHYVYQTWTGDCEIIVRVTAIEQTNAWVKAGLMIRADLTDTSLHATMVVTPPGGTNEFSFQWVDDHEDNRNNSSTGGGPLTLPEWVRLVRSGDDFIGYWAHDDGAGAPVLPWTQLNSQTVYMPATAHIGVCVTSHNTGTLSTCTFDNLGGDFVMDANSAWGPTPADGAIVDPTLTEVTWTAGDNAVTHNVYFGTNPAALTYRVTKPLGEPNYAPTGGFAGGTTYYWRIDEVNTAHTSSPWIGPVWSFSTYQDPGMGRITLNFWMGIPTAVLTNLTSDPRYPDNPDTTSTLTMFEGPQNYGADFGARMHGWLQPLTSGNYTFYVASDDDSELWLSTDWDRRNAELICWEYGVSGFRNWELDPATNEVSAAIPLIGGTRYYISGIWKEGGGGDYLSVAWQGPDQPTAPVDGEPDAIIDGYYLYPYTEMLAHNPNPSGDALVDPCEFVLCSWTAGAGAAEHDVYFGTDPNALTPYTRSEPNFVPPGGLEFGTTYYWRVDEVDVGNPESPWVGSLWSFTTVREPREPGMGKIALDLWFNMGGVDLDTLKNDPNYPHDPHQSSLLPTFEGPTTGYDTYDNYGGRMHGWLQPELSGDYIFYVCSDDPGELWLSSDMAPHNAELIAYETGVTGWRRQWQFGGTEDSNNVVGPIYLEGGNKYYIRGLWKEGGGGDYLAVAWQGPDQPDAPVPGEGDAIIVGYYLWPFVQLWAHRPNPPDEQVIEGYLTTYGFPPVTNIWTPLTFDPGVDANTHEAFFSDNLALVEARDESVSLGAPPNPDAPLWFYVGLPAYIPMVGPYNDSLVRGTTYYWCVDEFDGTDTWQGPVWSFTILVGEAWDPKPYDFEDLVSVTPVLTWERGAQTQMSGPHEHDIYFGTNRADVNAATIASPEYMGAQIASSPGIPGDETWEPNSDGGLPPLDRDTDYYWRIDEMHSRSVPQFTVVFKGDVWTFKTRPDIGIADVNEVGWWRFDRGYGLKAIDSSGHDRYGSLIGDPDGPTWVEQGKLNGALYFDRDNEDYVNIDGYKGISGANPFTVAAWIRKVTTEDCAIVTWGTDENGRRMSFRLNNTILRFEFGGGNVEGTTYLPDGEWHHVAMTVPSNATLGDVNLYVDGVDDLGVANNPANLFNLGQTADVSIGRRATHNDRFFNGIIDNVRIYDRELSAEEIPDTMRSDPGIAYNPDPENWADVHVGDVNLLTWSPGDGAGTHNVYFGTNPAALAGPYPRPLAEPNYDPGALQLGTTYYWRVDEVNGTVQTGDIWRFNVMSGSRGLVGDYYHFTGPTPPSRADTFAGSRVLTRIDPRIDFFWDGGSPDLNVNVDLFSVRWSGALQPDEDGTYTFLTYTDDGLRLWVDGELILENWTNHGSTWDTNEIELTAGETYTILMEYYENTGGARAELWWQTPSMPMRQFVPERVLAQPLWAYNPYPADGARLVDPAEVAACTWTLGAEAAWHEVYWGTDPNALTYRVTKPRGDETFLPTEGIGFAETYYWRVDEVNDTEVWEGDIWTFRTVRLPGMGTILVELWANLDDLLAPGNNLDDLKLDPRFLADTPDESLEVPWFHSGTQPLGPDPCSNNYGGRVHGWLIPETSGLYNFWLATDDPGELWLNPDGPDPSGAVRIAWIGDPLYPDSPRDRWSDQYQWFKYPEQQDSNNVVGLIYLEADQRYYISALWKEAGGGDHCVVAWYCPDSPDVNILPVNGSADAVIDGWYLMPFTRFWASNPKPYHTQELSADDITLLSWTPGIDANTHDVYFGISLSAVETGTPVISGLALDVNYYDPVFEGDITEWEWETTYYWRIDEVNDANTWTGSIWTFKTTNYAVLDDFEPYLSTEADLGTTEPNALRHVWKDGYWFWQMPPVKSKSGSNIMLTGPDDPPKPYLHWDDYRGGAQGLALYYDNDGNTIRLGHPDANIYPVHKYSEIEATTGSLGVDPNWTRQDIKALSLWFKGNPTGLKGSFELTAGDDNYNPNWPPDTYGPFDATIIAAGTDIGPVGPAGGPYHDEFHYAYKKLEPSEPNGATVYYIKGEIEARVDDVNNTNGWAKAGVMMRETWHVDSNFVMVVVTPGQGVALQYRDQKRGTVTTVQQSGITPPHWVRLSRDIYGWYYAEHANDAEHAQTPPLWHYINDDSAASTVGTADLGDGDTAIYTGLCLTSHNAAQLCKAEFSSIKFTSYELEGSWFTGFWNSRDIGIISNDPEPMYLALEDTSANVGVVYYGTNGTPDPNAVLIETWTPWNIDLNDPNFDVVDKSNVNKLYIGLGNRDYPTLGGSGVVYFDDIRLYRSRFVPGYYPLMLPGNIWRDPDGDPDGVVDWKDLMIMGRDWLITDVCYPTSEPLIAPIALYEFEGNTFDSIVPYYDGDPCGSPTYTTGRIGTQAISLNAVPDTNDYVVVGPVGIDGNSPRTIAGWAKANAETIATQAWMNVFGFTAGPNQPGGQGGKSFDIERRGNQDTYCLHVYGQEWNIMPLDQEWHHLAGTFDVNTVAWYGDGLLIGTTVRDINTVDNVHMGKRADNDAYFSGLVDDVRIYDYALSDAEAAYLALEGAAYLHIPVDSPANIYDHPVIEPPGKQSVNFRDFALMADYWLEEELKFPQ